MNIKLTQAAELITLALKAKLVPMLHGSPAVGKSAVIKQIAEDFNLKVIDLRLSQCDPTDLMGFPNIDQARARAGYVPMETFPIEGDPLPKGFSGWLLFLDEVNSAPIGVQAASYKLILDRMVGIHHLHKNVAIVCAGNLETDGAIVQPMSTALQSRLVHIEVRPDLKDWLDFANTNHFDYRITSYLEFRPDHLYTFDPDHSDKTYASPRTWEFMNKLLKVMGKPEKHHLALLAGTIGEGVGREFYGFCGIQDQLPKLDEIVRSPEKVSVPHEPSVQFALCGALAANVSEETVEPVMSYVKRLPAEFQVVCLRSTVRRNKQLLKTPAVVDWIATSSAELF